MVTGEGYIHASGFCSIPCQQVHQLTQALLELFLRVWIAWCLCLGFSWVSIETRTQALVWLMVLFRVVGPDGPQSAPAPPTQAGRAVWERRLIPALAALQQKASDDASLGIDRKPNGKPADVWLVSQHPTQPFLTASDCISLMILTLCRLLITTRWTPLFNLHSIACNS